MPEEVRNSLRRSDGWWTLKKLRRPNAECLRKPRNIHQAHIPPAPFGASDVRPIQSRQHGEFLLRHTGLLPVGTKGLAELLEDVGAVLTGHGSTGWGVSCC